MNYEHNRWEARTLERWSVGALERYSVGARRVKRKVRAQSAWHGYVVVDGRWKMEDGRAEVRGRRSEGKELRPPTSGVARPHHQSSATNDPSPAYCLIRS